MHKRKAKASSSSFSFSRFLPSMLVSLCQLLSSAGSGVVTTTLSLSACVVTYSATAPVVSAAPFVVPVEVTPVEPGHKQSRVESTEGRYKMMDAFENLWAARRR